MMLSAHDQRMLAQIEGLLRAEEPDLARRLERFDRAALRRARYRRHRVLLLALVSGVILLAGAFAAHNAPLLVLGALLLAGGAAGSVASALLRAIRKHSRERVSS